MTSLWKKKIFGRWAFYISEHSEDLRMDYNVMKYNFTDPPIMKDEIQAARRKMKSGKVRETFCST